MTFQELRDKALSLPLAPGVYIMRDQTDRVIYVGKAKKLKNRVSQYFQDSAAHTPKTKMMVSKIDHFDVVVAASEFEALVLECSLIKRYMPKYNILLKDDKGYPYLRLDLREPYPAITMVNRLERDGASYFGPYGSRSVSRDVIDIIYRTLKLPLCGKQFPREPGKERPCLNYQMGLCAGWCQAGRSPAEFHARMEQAKQLLSGDYKALASSLREQMLQAAEELKFEQAAQLRDRLNAVEALGQKQLVTAGAMADTDVVGWGRNEAKACMTVLHFRGGNLLEKDYQVIAAPDEDSAAISSLVKQYYLSRGIAPKRIFLPMEMEDGELFAQLLETQLNQKTHLHCPQRGDNLRLVELACKNAQEEALRVTSREERISGTLVQLGKMLSLTDVPDRLEAFDISNTAGTDIVAAMVVFRTGQPYKKGYKRFRVEGLSGQDDYASMRQVVERRFQHLQAGDAGFDTPPDVLLIDGGAAHARVAQSVLEGLRLNIPVFGMVKDDKHRTRALTAPDGREIGLDGTPAVFALIGRLQEEVHRFAITYHRKLQGKRLRGSMLDHIPGVGEKRKMQLLKRFGSVGAIAAAGEEELRQLLPRDAAHAVFDYFHREEAECES